MWVVWCARNQLLFNGLRDSVHESVTKINSLRIFCDSAFNSHLLDSTRTTNIRAVSWLRPSEGSISLNVDGSLLRSVHTAGFGGLMRNNAGEFLGGFYGSAVQPNILYAEILAILRGLELCWSKGYRNVACLSDSLQAVTLIKKGVLPFHSFANEIHQISQLRSRAWNVVIDHTLREGNRCADLLAKMGATANSTLVLLNDPPSELNQRLLGKIQLLRLFGLTHTKILAFSWSRNWLVIVPKKKRNRLVKILLLGVGIVVTVVVALLLLVVKNHKIYYTRWKGKNPTNLVIEVFLKKHESLQTKRYCYSEIKKVTNSFKNKLGQGGFGSVYKGQLDDGRYVAVKILNELKDSGEEFMNEVASICGTSHVNIVTLLGFCLEGSKRALVYEFMHNGSLEKFIFEENDHIPDLQLDCQTLYHIAIGVARGLEYLHKGCNTRILHFDIKPHNILLDKNFNPKISDFGLAKICARKESMVSMVSIFGARGTAGYIAPEVFSRNFGAVSHKSDVYSYGMMVMEMVGRRKNINTEVDRSSEIYFPHWIYNRLDSNQDLGLRNIRSEIDDEKVRKMTIVALWCIQTNPSTRPDVTKVVEMLEGRVELLPMPPKPFLSSPSNSHAHFSSETQTIESMRMLDAEQRDHS
ncbi:LEAF RUST 10 DISEASE-RESISTANCE LOCUS RECEPTOR-LIKE PROTEIN KINASE 2.5 [Trifolium repens]|nr:LEAF RUST 10 DISEASE-RESISTANCE LOCUS RECEPTOR-LIKE PROTEIN KINASE 2.5 [Trifolium repens]